MKLPGVLAVVTAADFPDLTDKVAMMGEAGTVHLPHLAANCIAHQKALYKGHAVAAVAATSPHIADEAALLIKVDYEVLPSVTWVLDAMKADAPLLHDEVRTDFMGKKAEKASNTPVHMQFVKGDIAQGFQEADVVVEREFSHADMLNQ